MTSMPKNVYTDKLDDSVNEHNNAHLEQSKCPVMLRTIHIWFY